MPLLNTSGMTSCIIETWRALLATMCYHYHVCLATPLRCLRSMRIMTRGGIDLGKPIKGRCRQQYQIQRNMKPCSDIFRRITYASGIGSVICLLKCSPNWNDSFQNGSSEKMFVHSLKNLFSIEMGGGWGE